MSLDTNYEKVNAASRHIGFFPAVQWDLKYGAGLRKVSSGGLSSGRNEGCPEMMDRTVGDAMNVYRWSGIAHLSISQEKSIVKETSIQNLLQQKATCSNVSAYSGLGVVTPDCRCRSRTRTVAFFGPAIVGVNYKES